MKKPEEYLKQVNSLTLREDLYKIGKQMMKDAIEYTLQQAAENAEWGICQNDDGQEPWIHESNIFINRDSILNLKDDLFKELE